MDLLRIKRKLIDIRSMLDDIEHDIDELRYPKLNTLIQQLSKNCADSFSSDDTTTDEENETKEEFIPKRMRIFTQLTDDAEITEEGNTLNAVETASQNLNELKFEFENRYRY